MANSRLCSIPDCGKPHKSRGWCRAHYERWKHHGDPELGGAAKGEVFAYYRTVVLNFSSDECLFWPYSTTDGYGKIFIEGRFKRVPRIACEEVNGPPPTHKHHAAHSCGNGHLGCVNPKHLRWATPKENNADKIMHGTTREGENNPRSKLSANDVREIRRLAGTETQRVIASRFGVSQRSISMLLGGVTWTSVV